jgi:hypothetical protein
LKVYDLESKLLKPEAAAETFSININEVRGHLFNLSARGTSGSQGNVLQNVGCMNTYLKRYLYLNMLNLVEDDAVEAAKPVDATAGRVSNSRDYHAQRQQRSQKPASAAGGQAGDQVPASNPKVEDYISKAASIHSPNEMNRFIASLKDEKLAPAEKHAIWHPITETAKLQGWQLVDCAYV